MAVAFDAVGPNATSAQATGATTISWTHTNSGSGVALTVTGAFGDSASSGKTFTAANLDPAGANTAIPTIGGPVDSGAAAGGTLAGFIQMWGLPNVSSGAHTVKLTASAVPSSCLLGGSVSYSGADLVSPFSTAQTTSDSAIRTSHSITFTGSTSGNIVTAGVVDGDNTLAVSAGTGRHLLNFDNLNRADNIAQGDIAGGGSVTLTWTTTSTDHDALIAVEVKVPSAAAGGGGGAKPGRTWLRRFHHRQAPPQFPPPAAAAAVSGIPPVHLVVARRSSARAVWRGFVSTTTNLQNGTVPDHLVIARRTAARAFWRGFVSETTNLLNGNAPDGVVYRRRAARGLWRGPAAVATTNAAPATTATVRLAHGFTSSRRPVGGLWGGAFTPTPNAVPPNGTVPDHLVVARRQAARVFWRGTVSTTTNAAPGGAVSGTAPDHLVIGRRAPARAVWRGHGTPPVLPETQTGGLIRRRPAARGVWRGTVSTTTNATPAQAVNGTVPDHLVIARRQPTRVVWAGTVSRTTNTVATNGTAPDHLVVARRQPARGLWRGNPVPGRLSRPVTGGLAKRRPPGRGAWRGYVSRTTNAPPPAFQVARSTPTVADPRDGTATVTRTVTSTPTAADPRDGTASVTRSVTSTPSVTDPRDGTSGVT